MKSKEEKLIELFKTKSNLYFSQNESLLRDQIQYAYQLLDDPYIPDEVKEPEKIFETLILNYISNLYEDFRWYSEEIDID